MTRADIEAMLTELDAVRRELADNHRAMRAAADQMAANFRRMQDLAVRIGRAPSGSE